MSAGTPVLEDPKEQQLEDKPHMDSDGEHLSALPVRDYDSAPEHVKQFYLDNHTHHTYESTRKLWNDYASPKARTLKAPMWDMLVAVGEFFDASDPDVEDPQIVHAFQSAESARENGEDDWMQATVLVHDVGKILATNLLPGREALPQWCVVGDTFPLGIKFDERIVLSKYFFEQPAVPDSSDPLLRKGWPGNPDVKHPVYGTEQGVYEDGVGLDNLTVSFGHDEFLFQVLNGNCNLPDGALRMIRYHSLYPIHSAGAYSRLLSEGDDEILAGVRRFNQYDLYSKVEKKPDIAALMPYYKNLVDKFFPEPLNW